MPKKVSERGEVAIQRIAGSRPSRGRCSSRPRNQAIDGLAAQTTWKRTGRIDRLRRQLVRLCADERDCQLFVRERPLQRRGLISVGG